MKNSVYDGVDQMKSIEISRSQVVRQDEWFRMEDSFDSHTGLATPLHLSNRQSLHTARKLSPSVETSRATPEFS
jgi:hypothetical protein